MPTGLTEPRWVRAIDIRPVGKNARKITHHALARLPQLEDMPAELFTNDPNVAGDGLFMEWAVGEEIPAHTELAVWLYPKGQEPKHREVLVLFNFNWHNMYTYDDDVAPLLRRARSSTCWRGTTTRRRTGRTPIRINGSAGATARRRDGPRLAEHHVTNRSA